MKKLGILTIGQSPREDVTPQFREILGNKVDIIERGALDSLNEADLSDINPKQGEVTYISKLRNGGSVKISKEKLIPLLQNELELLQDEAYVIVMLCTGDFPQLSSEKLILFPDKILTHLTKATFKKGRLGLIIPLEEQKESLLKKWKSLGMPIEVQAASPYADSAFKAAGEKLKKQGVTLIIMDCMGYNKKHKVVVTESTNLPVVLSQSIVASVAKEYLI